MKKELGEFREVMGKLTYSAEMSKENSTQVIPVNFDVRIYEHGGKIPKIGSQCNFRH